MKRNLSILLLASVALVTAACSAFAPATPTVTPTLIPPTATQEPSPTPTTVPTETPIPSPTLLPTIAPVDMASAGVLGVGEFSVTPPPAIATANWAQVPGTPFDPNIPASLNGMPPHLLVTFDQDQVNPNMFNNTQRQGRILPVQAYLSMYAQAGVTEVQARIQTLQGLLDTRPATIDGGIPVLPGITALQSLHAKVKYIDFTGGSGIAFLASYSQDVSPITNERLQYYFQGLSEDGQQYVSFVYPVTTSVLPNTAADVTPETMTALQTDPAKYLADTTALLDQAAPGSFSPDLLSLDAMFQSIRLGALPPTATPAPVGPNLVGTSWFWRSTVKADGSQVTITEYDNYMLEFQAGGQLKVLADCNTGGGTYTTNGTGITINVATLTKAQCPTGSYSDTFVSQLNASYAYNVQNGTLSLFSNDGTMVFGPTVVTTGTVTPTVGTGTPVASGPVGPVWYWVGYQGADGSSITIADPDEYSLQLMANGTAQIKADCNTASGVYTLNGSQLAVDVQNSTQKACNQGSYSDQFLTYLDSTASFVLNGNRLNISLVADAGIMRFIK